MRRAILLVEDEVLIRMMVAGELRRHGFKVAEAQNADDALGLLQSQGPFGVVVADVQLPGSIEGVALARLIREKNPEMKVIIASGTVSSVPKIADPFFQKPYAPNSIVQCIESLLATP